jgi:hypothetical protein
MAKKRTKADKLQRNVERLATRDVACREKSAINAKLVDVAEAPARPARAAVKK